MLAENVTVQPNILLQINSPISKSADFDVIPVAVPQAQSHRVTIKLTIVEFPTT